MTAYRIASRGHSIFEGAGAAEYGGRWNSPGRPVIYAAGSLSLAMLEQLAHSGTGRLPHDQAFVKITISKSVSTERVNPDGVAGWDADDRIASRAFGDDWLTKRRTCVLLTPSVIVPMEHNVVINPAHAEFAHIRVSAPHDLNWDKRLKTVRN